jgi:hypothetical protein
VRVIFINNRRVADKHQNGVIMNPLEFWKILEERQWLYNVLIGDATGIGTIVGGDVSDYFPDIVRFYSPQSIRERIGHITFKGIDELNVDQEMSFKSSNRQKPDSNVESNQEFSFVCFWHRPGELRFSKRISHNSRFDPDGGIHRGKSVRQLIEHVTQLNGEVDSVVLIEYKHIITTSRGRSGLATLVSNLIAEDVVRIRYNYTIYLLPGQTAPTLK